MSRRRRGDAGQAFPIYVVMVAGLLFLAFAFFAVGKASALRNGSQGAADAAALAAAQSAREQFAAGFHESLPGDQLDQFLNAAFPTLTPCAEAQRLASANGADIRSCGTSGTSWDRDKITVEVEGRQSVDSPVIPGTESTFAKAEATALIEFRCTWVAEGLDSDGDSDSDSDGDGDSDGAEGLYTFACGKAGVAEVVPGDLADWPRVSKILFDVRLVDQ
ncbi:pilus assembly protein TadG-related protein [Streptomyces sp. NPDC059452]|uniref:pilus assembly protein TadG-related protein n=1 Tax=Streptomyces sp. NPDC059452 TaxID=3346835 RepID=UPI00367F6B66